MRPRHTLGILALILVLVSVAAAGCGGGGSPGVANLGTTGTTTDPSSGGAPSGSGPSTHSLGGSGGQMMLGGGGLAFSRCMRAHGVKNFPDPNSQGQVQLGSGSGVDPNSATFRAAQQACQKELGGGQQLSPAQQVQVRQHALAFAACMRKHGVPDFPDPNFSGGGIGFSIQGNANSDLNPNSPTFKAAQQACQGRLAFPGKGKTSSSGGAK